MPLAQPLAKPPSPSASSHSALASRKTSVQRTSGIAAGLRRTLGGAQRGGELVRQVARGNRLEYVALDAEPECTLDVLAAVALGHDEHAGACAAIAGTHRGDEVEPRVVREFPPGDHEPR